MGAIYYKITEIFLNKNFPDQIILYIWFTHLQCCSTQSTLYNIEHYSSAMVEWIIHFLPSVIERNKNIKYINNQFLIWKVKTANITQ